MTIEQALKKYNKIEIDILLSHVLGKSREFLFMNPENRLTRKQADRLTRMIKRREKGEPIAYILGYKDFYGLRFKVNKNVLIPRPETEMVVDLVNGVIASAAEVIYKKDRHDTKLKPLLSRDDTHLKVLDIGTGSGCIIVSIGKQLEQLRITNCELYGSDVSAKALVVAKQNAKAHRVPVKFIKSSLLKNIKFNPDIIIANLPYGWKEWKNNTSAATVGLKFEPQRALFTKENGLYLIRQLLEQIENKKLKPQAIFLEFDPRQKAELKRLIKKLLPGSQIRFFKDFRNLWRYAEIYL